MKKQTISIPLATLPPEQTKVGGTVQLTATGQITSLEGDEAEVELQTVNGQDLGGETEAAPGDEETMRRLAATADDESWKN